MSIPTNWHHTTHVYVMSPIGYQVAEARNQCVQTALEGGKFDWLFFIDHDTIPNPDTCIILRDHMLRNDTPIISGLYYTKASFPEPLLFRGRGTGPFYGWEHGDKVWVDGVPCGMLMVHMSIFRHMSPPWFVTPKESMLDEKGSFVKVSGTEDLYWCDRILKEKVLEKAGWTEAAKREYPLLVDTNLFCQHIDLATGLKYPHCTGDAYKTSHSAYRTAYYASLEGKNDN
jgi:hypothetical protein